MDWHRNSGIIDLCSWSYWHLVLGVFPAPALPKREFGTGGIKENELNALLP